MENGQLSSSYTRITQLERVLTSVRDMGLTPIAGWANITVCQVCVYYVITYVLLYVVRLLSSTVIDGIIVKKNKYNEWDQLW